MNDTTNMLGVTDHRPGSFGDYYEIPCDTLEEAHGVARELNCGIYAVTFPHIATLTFESDGEGAATLVTIDKEA